MQSMQFLRRPLQAILPGFTFRTKRSSYWHLVSTKFTDCRCILRLDGTARHASSLFPPVIATPLLGWKSGYGDGLLGRRRLSGDEEEERRRREGARPKVPGLRRLFSGLNLGHRGRPKGSKNRGEPHDEGDESDKLLKTILENDSGQQHPPAPSAPDRPRGSRGKAVANGRQATGPPSRGNPALSDMRVSASRVSRRPLQTGEQPATPPPPTSFWSLSNASAESTALRLCPECESREQLLLSMLNGVWERRREEENVRRALQQIASGGRGSGEGYSRVWRS